jgi:hypothetical protein
LKLVLSDGRPATLLVGEASTVLSVDDTLVSSWDLAGRPYALVRESGSYRRGLDGGLLLKREATSDAPRVRRRLSAAEGTAVVEAARAEAMAARDAITTARSNGDPDGPLVTATAFAERSADRESTSGPSVSHEKQGTPERRIAEALDRLNVIASMDSAALRSDAERFLAVCGPVGLLPPDQYLSLVVRVTEGCSWNACTFCRLYASVPFRAKSPAALARHVAALRDYFARSLALRRSVFLGDANALCLAQERLRPLVQAVATAFPGAPLFSFVDAWTGRRKTAQEWSVYRALGLRRVYVGLETGDPGLLSWLGKPGTPDDAVRLVSVLHEGGLDVGVIVLVGAGGERFSAAHVARTVEVLDAMRLGPADIVYLSEYVDDPMLAYGRHAAGEPDLAPLAPDRARAQHAAIMEAIRRSPGPRLARYDLREFVY